RRFQCRRADLGLPRPPPRAGARIGRALSAASRPVLGDTFRRPDRMAPLRPPAAARLGTMRWLGFFAASSAWLALLVVPLVFVYFLKLRRPRQQISSLALWYQVINDQRVNSPFQKFKRNLLLLLQLLVLACLVLAAMQPFLPRASVRAQYQPVQIDCSASMG